MHEAYVNLCKITFFGRDAMFRSGGVRVCCVKSVIGGNLVRNSLIVVDRGSIAVTLASVNPNYFKTINHSELLD